MKECSVCGKMVIHDYDPLLVCKDCVRTLVKDNKLNITKKEDLKVTKIEIKITESTYRKLLERTQPGESYDDTLQRIFQDGEE